MAMFDRRLVAMIFGAALLASAAGCNNNNNSTIPSAVLSSDDFSDTLAVGGESVKTFNVDYLYGATDAGVTVKTLTSVATGAAINVPIGVAFGTFTSFNNGCTRAASATKNDAMIGQEAATNSGTFTQGQYCVVIFDPGTLTEAVNYTMTVRHY